MKDPRRKRISAAFPPGDPAPAAAGGTAFTEQEIEQQVRDRTRELTILNEELHSEILARIRMEELLLAEKAFLEAMESCLNAGVLEIDRKGRHTYVNDALCAMTGFSREELIGSGMPYPYWPAEERAANEKFILDILKRSPIPDNGIEMRFLSRDRRQVCVALYASPMMLKGKIHGHVVTVHNITGRKKMETDLRESEESFRCLIQNLPEGICIILDGEVVLSNVEQRRILGISADCDASRWFDNVHPDDAESFKALLSDGLTYESGIREKELRILPRRPLDPAAEMMWVRCKVVRFRYHRGNALMVVMMDTTRVKEFENIIAVQERLSSLGQITAGIAHEIRNPLSGINMSVYTIETLIEEAAIGDPEVRANLLASTGRMKILSTRIGNIVKKIMDFSKPTPAPYRSIDLNIVIDESIRMMGTVFRNQGITVVRDLGSELPNCHADSILLEHLLYNLIDNAIRAMGSCTGPKLLEIRSIGRNKRILVNVSDSGHGVPHRIRNRIFDPFFTTRKDGHGIGLAICHRIVTEHGGTITVGKSRWGGADFQISLPADAS